MFSVVLLMLGWASAVPRHAAAQEAQGPNVVFIYIDDMGWSDLSYRGSTFYETPRIDRLAARGMRFTSAYANAPNCAPSRASLMSGAYAPRHGVYTVGDPWRAPPSTRRLVPLENRTTLAPEVITLAEVLRDAGYATAHMGKWHLGEPAGITGRAGNAGSDGSASAGGAGPLAQGFDVNLGGTHAGHPPTYFSPYDIATLPDGPPGEYLTDRLTEEALAFIDEHADERFFLYLSHYAVHVPIEAPEELTAKYAGKPAWHGQRDAGYAAMIERVDHGVGRVVDRLDELGLTDETLIVFTSDNGGLGGYASAGLPGSRQVTDNYPLKGGKGQLYEGGIRVPTFVVWPGTVEPGSVSHEPIVGMDFYPTLVEAAGADLPPDQPIDGVSLLPVLQGGELDRETLYWYFPAYLEAYGREGERTTPAGAVRRGDEKLIWFFEDDRTKLYDLGDDPGERRDLAAERPERVRALRQLFENWLIEMDAPMPRPNPDYRP